MVEHNLAKVGVAGSNPVSRSKIPRPRQSGFFSLVTLAAWQSGYAAACKAVYAGSIPTAASIHDPPKAAAVESCGFRIFEPK